ncbi:MAG TPA: hypothetical protein PLP73_03920, partial [Candidatus Absconditabacterales bacterium]|nr:hypothetical protein [Candidatus Absconditabacterales bacterium]
KINAKYDAELKALEESNSASTVKPTLPTRSVNKNDVSNKRNRRNFDFSDVSDQLENNKAIPVSDLTLLDDLQSSIMGEISEKLLTATVSSESDLIELDMINEVSNDKLHTLANTLDDLLDLGESIAFPNSKPISVSDLEILIDGKNESGIPYFKLFKDRVKLATQELLDMDQQKEAGLLDLDSELNEAQNRDQMNEDANRLFNPTNKVSKKEKLLYNSLVKEVDPTGTGLFTTYYNYKDIKPKIISLLSIGNDNYYEPNTQKALDILRKKDFDWIQPLLNKPTDHSKYDPQLMEVLKQQVLVFNRNLEANYMQIYVDYKTENAGVPGQEYKIPVYRVGPITADFNRREVVMDIIDTIDGLNGIVPEPISRIKETRVSEILDSIGFDLTDIDRDELNTIIKDTKYLKKEIEGIITGKKLSTSNIKKVADFISSTRKTPQLSQLDNGKSVGLFITPSQLGEDLSKFANSTRDAKIQEFSHVSAKDTLAFFKSNKLKFGIASLAFRADTDKKLSEYNEMEYIQAAFNMFFSEQNGKSWYITATPSDGGTNYLVEFENLKIKDFNVNRLS